MNGFTGADISAAMNTDLGGGGSWLDKLLSRPEMLAIALDKFGQNLDPNNPAAGIGGYLGTSSLANKALAEQRQEQRDFRKLIADMVSGRVPTTAPGQPGLSGAVIKPGKEEGTTELSFNVTEPIDNNQKKEKYLDMRELMSLPLS